MASQATLDRLCAEFDSPPEHIAAAVDLLEQNATPAYLARYRRHDLGHQPVLRQVAERLHLLNELEQRRATILEQAEERGRKTPELEQTLANTADQDLLDDYYQSMRPRRRGIAMQMEEKGLAPLALAIQHRQFGDAAIMTVPAPAPAPVEEPKSDKPAEAAAAPADGEAATDGPATDGPAAGDEAAGDQAASADAADATEATAADAQASEAPATEDAAADAPATADATTDTADAPVAAAAAPEAPVADAHTAEAQTAEAQTDDAKDDEAPATEAPAAPATDAPAGEAVPDVDLRKLAEPYVSAENELPTPEAALEGALLILADRILHDPKTRARFRDELRRGILRAKPVNPDGDPGKYKQFFDFAEPINRIPSNRMLALRRAEREKILRLELGLPKGRHR
ncbi:MAG: hypothetical protein KAI24_12515, partial [Planctomycetes bacterium]|nr:hypothetical protein [Planctomycetota bacterium]